MSRCTGPLWKPPDIAAPQSGKTGERIALWLPNRAARPFAVNDNGRTIKVFSPKDPELMLPSEIKEIEDAIVAQVKDLEDIDGPVRIEWCDGVPD